jgi:DNA polymerase III delta prime subunit
MIDKKVAGKMNDDLIELIEMFSGENDSRLSTNNRNYSLDPFRPRLFVFPFLPLCKSRAPTLEEKEMKINIQVIVLCT